MLKKELIFGYLTQLVTFIGGVFFLIFIPKFAGVETYGKFMLILTYISLFGVFMGVPIQEAIKKELVENKLNEIGKKYVFNGYFLRLIINIIFFIVFYFLYKNIKGFENISYFLILGIFLFINISGLPQNIFLSLHQNKSNFYFVLMEYFLQIFLLFLFYFSKGYLNIYDILIAFIIGYGLPTVFFSIYIILKNNIKLKIDRDIMKVIFKRYFLLSLASVSFLLLTNIDNIMISYFFTEKELGYYSIATGIVNKTTIFSIALVTSILPLFHLKQPKEKIKAIFKKYFKLLFFGNLLLSLLIFLLAGFGINLIYGEGYETSIKIMQIISLFPLFAIIQAFLSGILTNFGKYKELMYISIFISFLNIILNYILANIFGIYGISIVTIFSYLIWVTILFIFYHRFVNN